MLEHLDSLIPKNNIWIGSKGVVLTNRWHNKFSTKNNPNLMEYHVTDKIFERVDCVTSKRIWKVLSIMCSCFCCCLRLISLLKHSSNIKLEERLLIKAFFWLMSGQILIRHKIYFFPHVRLKLFLRIHLKGCVVEF